MSPFGEFGPLDVQVFKADEIFERRSGLLSKSAVWSLTEEAFRIFEQVLLGIKMRSGGTVGFKTSSNVAASITAGLLAPVMSQLDPLAIGEDYQNLHIAQAYGHRLVEKFGAIDEDAVTALVENYPSHGFVIDLFEASHLFGNVEMATPELMELQACLAEFTHRPNSRDAVVMHVNEIIGGENDEVDAEAGGTDSDASDRASAEDTRAHDGDRKGASGTRKGRTRNGDASDSPAARDEPTA